MYATRWDTRGDLSFSAFRTLLYCFILDEDVRVITDPTSDYHLIFLTTCTDQTYEMIKFEYHGLINEHQIEWDYFNFNEIEGDE